MNIPKFEGIVNQPIMYSTYYKTGMLQELFLDYFISSGIQEILRKKASKDDIRWQFEKAYSQDCD